MPRTLKIPNPFAYIKAADALHELFPTLQEKYRESKLSLSRPRMAPAGRAVVPQLKMNSIERRFLHQSIGSRYFAIADVAQFYPSIYTHSVPWALVGREQAKIQKDKATGGQLDKALREMQQNQTIGVPIGPDLSLCVAELLLCGVDTALSKRRGHRYIDDYVFYCRNYAEAEQVLADLAGEMAEYELSLNPRKCHVEDSPFSLTPTWRGDLRRYGKDCSKARHAPELAAKAAELRKQHPQAGVIRYAVRMLGSLATDERQRAAIAPTLLHLAQLDSSTLPTVLVTLDSTETLNSVLPDFLSELITRHGPLGHSAEVAWCLWAALRSKVRLDSLAWRTVGAMHDDVVAVLALTLESEGLAPSEWSIPEEWWSIAIEPDAAHSDHWLLGHELTRTEPTQRGKSSFTDWPLESFVDVTTMTADAAGPVPGLTEYP